MLNEGVVIMVSGMLVVFVFLILMVLSMNVMSGICIKRFPEEPEPENQSNEKGLDVAIAIAAAYTQR